MRYQLERDVIDYRTAARRTSQDVTTLSDPFEIPFTLDYGQCV